MTPAIFWSKSTEQPWPPRCAGAVHGALSCRCLTGHPLWAETHVVMGMVGKWRFRGVRVRSFQARFDAFSFQKGESSYEKKKKSVYCFVLWEWCFGVEGNEMASQDTGCASASRVCRSAAVQWNQCGKGVESDRKEKYGCCDTASSAENSASAVHLGYCHYSAPLPLLPPPPLLRWPETPPGASGARRSQPLPPSAQPRWMAGDLWAYSNGQSLTGRGISEEESEILVINLFFIIILATPVDKDAKNKWIVSVLSLILWDP